MQFTVMLFVKSMPDQRLLHIMGFYRSVYRNDGKNWRMRLLLWMRALHTAVFCGVKAFHSMKQDMRSSEPSKPVKFWPKPAGKPCGRIGKR